MTYAPSSPIDLSMPVELSDGIFWVGRREGTLLERNIYLRVFGKAGEKQINMVIDPGPPADLTVLTQKVGKVIGSLRNTNVVFANHQDPDVTYNAGFLQKLNPNLVVVCSEDTWRLIQFYDLKRKNFRSVESFREGRTSFPSGHTVQFVPSPFCHFRGAVMLYDLESRILFTGDLFGGLSYHQDLFADERHWDGVKTFHQIYMPSQEALRTAVDAIRALDPAPLLIAPQHGSLITGKWIDVFLDRVAALPVGLDLLRDSQTKDNYIAALNELLLDLCEIIGAQPTAAAMRVFRADGSFPNVLVADSGGVKDIKVDPRTALEHLMNELYARLPEQREVIENSMMRVLMGRNIPLPESFGREGGLTPRVPGGLRHEPNDRCAAPAAALGGPSCWASSTSSSSTPSSSVSTSWCRDAGSTATSSIRRRTSRCATT